MSASWRRLWVAAVQAIPVVVGAGIVTAIGYQWGARSGQAGLALPAALLALLALTAVVVLELRSPWGESTLMILAFLLGTLLAAWLPNPPDHIGMALAAGVGLMLAAGLAGPYVFDRAGRRWRTWLIALSWLYFVGWIPIVALAELRPYAVAWALMGLIVFLSLTAIWTATIQAAERPKLIGRAALQIYLLGLNITLALTMLLSSGD